MFPCTQNLVSFEQRRKAIRWYEKIASDSYAACATERRRRAAGTRRGRMSLACRTSFPVSPGKSIQRPRHDVQHPHRAPERSTVITILHVTLSAHPTNEKKRWKRWRRHGYGGRRRTRRMRTLTTLQYTGGHGVYKPPQFYLRPF